MPVRRDLIEIIDNSFATLPNLCWAVASRMDVLWKAICFLLTSAALRRVSWVAFAHRLHHFGLVLPYNFYKNNPGKLVVFFAVVPLHAMTPPFPHLHGREMLYVKFFNPTLARLWHSHLIGLSVYGWQAHWVQYLDHSNGFSITFIKATPAATNYKRGCLTYTPGSASEKKTPRILSQKFEICHWLMTYWFFFPFVFC